MLRIVYTDEGTAVPDMRCPWYLRTVYERSLETEVEALVSTENVIHEAERAVAEGTIPEDRVVIVIEGKEYAFSDRRLPKSFPSVLRKTVQATRAALVEQDRQAMQETINMRRATAK